jgi:radical SAM protein with 4Fe4S-binding SPASM domain
LKEVETKGFPFVILSNGTKIVSSVAKKLLDFKNLRFVQISLDGITEAVHSITRGKGFEETMAAIRALSDHNLPFFITPTVHKRNAHELFRLKLFAHENGGEFRANVMKVFPYAASQDLALSPEQSYDIITEMAERIIREFGDEAARDFINGVKTDLGSFTPICGVAEGLIDLDWNGDVYPCQALKIKELKLGNLKTDSFDRISEKVREMGIRVPANKLSKCRKCKFVGVCGGGCRASAYYAHGSFEREDEQCSLYQKIFTHQYTLLSG